MSLASPSILEKAATIGIARAWGRVRRATSCALGETMNALPEATAIAIMRMRVGFPIVIPVVRREDTITGRVCLEVLRGGYGANHGRVHCKPVGGTLKSL